MGVAHRCGCMGEVGVEVEGGQAGGGPPCHLATDNGAVFSV